MRFYIMDNGMFIVLHLRVSWTFSDVHECVDGTHNCHKNASCTNVNGSFYCNCNPDDMGYGTFC